MEKHKFCQIRMIEWIKTNPQPINSKVNYLTNCREIALVGVKGGSPTFNSKYDKGLYEDSNSSEGQDENEVYNVYDDIYHYPMASGKYKFHPTQKHLKLFEDIIKKHSNENDLVLDTFLGSGTTAIACKNTKRRFKGCEISQEYYDKINEVIML